MPRGLATPTSLDRARVLGSSTLILQVTAALTGLGLLLVLQALLTRDYRWAIFFFRSPAAVLMVCFSILGLWQSIAVCRYFAPGDMLRKGWQLIAFSAGCDLAGNIGVQFGAGVFADIGHVIGGTFRFALLTGGFYYALAVYRRSGLLGQLRWFDKALIAGVGLYVIVEAVMTATAFQHGKKINIVEVLSWPVDVMLWALMTEALWLFRSAQSMGGGLTGRTWKAFAAAIFLVILGDIGIWAFNYGYVPWPWTALTWCIWLPATAAFALAPTYQLEAIRRASR